MMMNLIPFCNIKKENTFMLSFYLFLLFIFLSLILHDIFHPTAQNLA